jgi:hypothetical protein
MILTAWSNTDFSYVLGFPRGKVAAVFVALKNSPLIVISFKKGGIKRQLISIDTIVYCTLAKIFNESPQ